MNPSIILVTGATGFLGRHIVPVLRQAFPQATVIGVGRKDGDLLEPGTARRLLQDTRPDTVVHLAAKVGGIIANRKYPADFYYENITINTHCFHESFRAGVRKFLTLMGGCSYPTRAVSPIGEDQMWEGYPQVEAAPYSIAKRVMLVQSDSYRRQYGFNSIVLVPGNVYGEHDNFKDEYAHVIPALVRRFIEATDRGVPSMACYGTGRPTRDFVYAGDVAALIPWFLQHYDTSEPINISSGRRVSIRELADTMKRVTGFQGEITWDTTKPDGQIDKIFKVDKLHALGLSCSTPLETGLRKTADWFVQARRTGDIRL